MHITSSFGKLRGSISHNSTFNKAMREHLPMYLLVNTL